MSWLQNLESKKTGLYKQKTRHCEEERRSNLSYKKDCFVGRKSLFAMTEFQ